MIDPSADDLNMGVIRRRGLLHCCLSEQLSRGLEDGGEGDDVVAPENGFEFAEVGFGQVGAGVDGAIIDAANFERK